MPMNSFDDMLSSQYMSPHTQIRPDTFPMSPANFSRAELQYIASMQQAPFGYQTTFAQPGFMRNANSGHVNGHANATNLGNGRFARNMAGYARDGETADFGYN